MRYRNIFRDAIWHRLAILIVVGLWSGWVNAAPINQMVFFGDSLSDNGNLYHSAFKIIPKSPPYYMGRFSNGPTWAEDLGKYYYNKYYTGYSIYAVGGATAIWHFPNSKFVAPSLLELQIRLYQLETLFQDKTTTLYAFWVAANDYMYDYRTDYDQFTTEVVDKIAWAVNSLMDHGGRYFLILNLPDLSRTPMIAGTSDVERLRLLSSMHNQKLAAFIQSLKTNHPDVKVSVIDIQTFFNDALDHPDKYNKKYHTDFKFTAEPCWGGGYTYQQIMRSTLSSTMLKDSIIKQNGKLPMYFDENKFSAMVLGSSELAYTYQMGKLFEAGVLPCSNSNQYVFWDHVHPTEGVHEVLAQIVEETLAHDMQF